MSRPHLDRLRRALEILADFVLAEPEFAEVFARIDREIAAAEANDPVQRARIIAAERQRAIG